MVKNLLGGADKFRAIAALSVGIASVVALLSVGVAQDVELKRKFERVGINNRLFRFTPEQNMAGLKASQVAAVKREVPGIDLVTPISVRHSLISNESGKVKLQMIAVYNDFFQLNGLSVNRGRTISDLDGGMNHCVLGVNVMKSLSAGGQNVDPGSTLQIDSKEFLVVGVLNPLGATPAPVNVDNSIFVHSQTAERMFDDHRLIAVQARAYMGTDLVVVSGNIINQLGQDGAEIKTVVATSGKDLMAQMEWEGQMLVMLFGFIGVVFLILGGAWFMEFLLAKVDERKQEIAVRKAFGARSFDIQMRYLVDALVFSIIIGPLGAVLGVFMARMACDFVNWRFFLSVDSLFIGFGISVLFVLLLGTYPAIRASQIDIVSIARS